MRFLFLGTGAADWKRPQDTGEYRRNTSTLVDGEMLIDGNETISEALPMLENVPAMLFTHSHGDHYSKPFLQRVRPRRVFCEESWAEEAGARHTYLIEEPIAAAIGAGIDIAEPRGNMVVDIGGGTTDVALISLGGAVLSDSIKIAGDKFDDAIVRYMRKKHNLLIGERTAEEMKIRIGSAYPRREQLFIDVKGRNLISGLPQAIVVGSNEMIDALEEPLQAILESVRTMFEKTPPELASDVAENGICLTGGGALLYGIDKFISEHTKVPCYIAEDPISCVAIGTGKVLENIDSFTRGAIYDYRRGEYYTD